ncbi:hypothetical protein [Pelobium manganitolerans]|uniref:hypothetical protein n=1 Tax=Pelobium manganitolerans TaxID=1842495 RepID=UPI003FA3D929
MKGMVKIVVLFAVFSAVACKNKIDSQLELSQKAVQKLESENEHLKEFIAVNSQKNFIFLPALAEAYEVSDTGRKKPIQVFNNITRKTLVVRYTAIGCNACSDLFFKKLNQQKDVLNKYDVLVLADYSDYVSFLKWYKIAEVNQKVLQLEKGSIPLPLEQVNSSYVFVIDRDKRVSSLFIPRSLFPEHISLYLKSLV